MQLKNAVRLVTPRWAAEYYRRRATIHQAKALRNRSEGLELEALLDTVNACPLVRSIQKRSEILSLLALVCELRPRTFCEIGACGGGTLAMFCQVADPSARILSIDIAFNPIQMGAFPHLARKDQHLTCLAADTHAEATRAAVARWLDGGTLDFLFIDGDHSLAGVSRDFEMYAPFVRKGGIIAFHDVFPDSRTRHGITTASDVGEVPAFWADLKTKYPHARELIEDPGQDGYGIGVLNW